MKLGVLGVLLCLTSSASAEGAFEEYAAGVAARPAERLVEASCTLDIQLRGAVATFELRQRIVNRSNDTLAGRLELPLPPAGRVTYFAWKQRGAVEVALPVRADSPTVTGGSPGIVGVDPATLFAGTGDRYSIVMQPLAPADEAILTTRFVALAQPGGSGLALQLPSRQAVSGLTACTASLQVSPGPGATVQHVRIGERLVKSARATFVHADRDVTLFAALAIAGTQPIAWSQSQRLADGQHATLLTVLGPVVPARGGPRRVVFVVDGSRSMDLVGRQHVTALVERIAKSLPSGSEIEAIVYDRKAARVWNELRPASATNIDALTRLLATRGSTNGSDIVGAFQLARTVLSGTRGVTTLVLVTDGVTADLPRKALIDALGAQPALVDLHAFVLDPASTQSPGAELLRAPVNHYGGAFVELAADDVQRTLQTVDEQMKPAWLGLALAGQPIPSEVASGGGFTYAFVQRAMPRLTVGGRGLAVRAAPAAPIAALAFVDELEAPELAAKIRAAHPVANATTAFAVLQPAGTIARSRREVTRGGGRYDRLVAVVDPTTTTTTTTSAAAPTASAIARTTLERLFREQLQPRAYVCYQRALGANSRLVGTAQFTLRMGRGEVTDVQLVGLGDAQLDGCLLDAAYALAPPAPDFAVNADDQTIANYPLAFTRKEDKTVIVLGDADSTSPIDIDAIERANDRAARKKKVEVDAKTPLGGLKAPRSP